jgi:hypothetical protein
MPAKCNVESAVNNFSVNLAKHCAKKRRSKKFGRHFDLREKSNQLTINRWISPHSSSK